MRIAIIALVLCACVCLAAGDVAHLKAAKARLIGRLAKGKHHKRGVLSGVPPFKLGHDIPHVTHSVVKPIVVNYPPTASVTAVKVPLSNPLLPRYPVPVGHKVPVPHPHYGLKFPHHTKAVVLPKPDHHFHHHHHHVSPRPVIHPVIPEPVPATQLIPVGQPTATIAHPVPAPPPPVILHTQGVPQPVPVSNPVQIIPPHLHLKPVVPAPVPIQPAPLVSPVFPLTPQFPYVLRPGNAVQTSLFATYPRYPLVNYQSPLIPFSSTASLSQVLYNRPQVPHYHLYPQGDAHDGVVVEQPAPPVPVEPTPTLLQPAHGEYPQPAFHLQPVQPDVHLQSGIHLHPNQPGIHFQSAQPGIHLHPEQAGVHLHAAHPDIHLQPAQPGVHLHPEQPDIHLQPTQPGIHLHSAQPDVHLQPAQPGFNAQPVHPDIHLQPTQPSVNLDHNGWSPVPTQPNDLSNHPESQYPQTNDPHHHFTQEQGTQVFEHHTGQDQYNDFQNQLQHHIQQQIEQAQYGQHLNNQHQLSQEYGVPQNLNQEYGQPSQEFSQHGQEYAQHGQEYAQHGQEYAQHGQEYSQHEQEYAQHGQEYAQHGQEYSQHEQEYAQHVQNEYNLSQQQPGQEYGLPQQGAEGRSAPEGEADTQLYHNHIPLGLQPPIDRPLEHFR